MAKNSPLVGHFPVCTPAFDRQPTRRPDGSDVALSGQPPAFTLKMSAPSAMHRPMVNLALRMLGKMMHESVQCKRRAPRGSVGRGRTVLLHGTHSGQKMLDRTTRKGVECAAPVAFGQDALRGASGEESGNGSSRRDRAARCFLRRQSRVEHRECLLLRAPITFRIP